MTSSDSLTLRLAGPADALALLELASLDSAHQLEGAVLLAEVGGEPWAVIELATGRVVADPFRPTAQVVELLRLRAELLSDSARSRRRVLPRLLPRAA